MIMFEILKPHNGKILLLKASHSFIVSSDAPEIAKKIIMLNYYLKT